MGEKKKKSGLSWIEEILNENSAPLEDIFKKEKNEKSEKGKPGKGEKKKGIPEGVVRSEGFSLENILSTGAETEKEATKEKDEKKPKDKKEKKLGVSLPSSHTMLADILKGGEERKQEEAKETKRSAPQKKEEKKPIAPYYQRGGGVSLETILQRPEPTKSAPSLGEILGTGKVERGESVYQTYSGEVKVLDVYGNVRILKVRGEPVPIYELRIPKLSDDEKKLLKKIKERAISEIQIDPDSIPDFETRRRVFLKAVRDMIKEVNPHLSEGRIEFLSEYTVQNMIGYGRLDPLVRDDNLEEIMVIGTNKPVYVWHRRFNMCKTNILFENEKEIMNIIERIAREVGRRIDQQSPLLDARLPDGSRVNATIPPISLEGPTITIRKFKKDPLTIIDLIKYGTLNTDIAALLWIFVDGLGVKPANILVAGGTGSGKTTMLNSLAMFIPPSERVISIEDTAELQLPIEHWVRLETRPPNLEGKGEVTMDDLVRNTLRMRPDRIIVGEVRGPEARTMFTAMNTGHNGALYDFSIIQLSNGKFELIGNLCDRLFSKYAGKIRKYRDMEYVELGDGDRFEVVSVGPDLKAGRHTVTHVWRRKVRNGEKLIKITTRTGHEVVLTRTHPFFVFSSGDVVRKKAGNVKQGDRVAVMMRPPKMPERTYRVPPEVYSGISRYYLVPDPEGNVSINGMTYRRVRNTGNPPENAEYLLSPNSKPVKLVREVDERLAYIVGVILGDGYISSDGYTISATFDDEDYMNAFIKGMEAFLPLSLPRIRDSGMSKVVEFGSRIFAELLSRVFSMPKGKKSETWSVPDPVLHSTKTIRAFLAGVFDADAYVDSSGPSIILSTKSEEGARKVWYALQRLGIISIVSKQRNRGFKEGYIFRVTVSGVRDLKKFHNLIPLRNSKRRKMLENVIENKKAYRGSHVYRVPVSGKMIRPLRERLNLTVSELARLASVYSNDGISESLIRHIEHNRMSEVRRIALKGISLAFQKVAVDLGDSEAFAMAKKLELIADGDVYWDTVVNVEEVDPKELGITYLYDLTVDEDHNYVANGVLVSNCMGTIHSNSARETIIRLESPPMNVPRIMIPALDIILMLVRFNSRKKGVIRRVTEIAEVSGIEGESIQLNKLYKYDPAKDELESTGVPSRFIAELAHHTGMSIAELEVEKEKRKLILDWMIEKGIRGIEKVGHYIRQFYIDQETLLKRIEADTGLLSTSGKVSDLL